MKFLFLNLLILSSFYANTISFLSLEDDASWKINICENSKCKIIDTKKEVRSFSFNKTKDKLVYVASDGTIRLIHKNKEKIILKDKKNIAFIQARFYTEDKIVFVRLIDKKSKFTEILSFDLKSEKIEEIHTQKGTLLEPKIQKNLLYYTFISCVDTCSNIIQELWVKNLSNNQARQLTLFNTIAHQADILNKQIVFSVKNGRFYNIYQLDLKTQNIKQLTNENISDVEPTITKNKIYFIRKTINKDIIMSIENNKLKVQSFDKSFKKIRNMEILRK